MSPSPAAPPSRDRAVLALVALLARAAVIWLGLDRASWGDWTAEARPSVDLLLADRVGAFLRAAPAYGGSLLERAPFFELTRAWHGGGRAVYRAGALPCLTATTLLGAWLSGQMARRGCGLLARGSALALCIANPLVIPALQLGHPEELLGGVLCVAAVLCAQRDRAVWSGVLLGLAVADKSWGVLAAGPVLVALPTWRGRGRALMAAALAGGALIAPFMVVRSGGVAGQAAAAGVDSGGLFGPWQLWWFLGHHVPDVPGSFREAPAWLANLGHTLPIAVMPALTLAYRWCAGRRAADPAGDALLLLALLFALRCALDPWDTAYYAIPFCTALLAWETTTHDRAPVIALFGAAVCWLIMQEAPSVVGDARDVLALLFAAAALPAIVAMSSRLLDGRVGACAHPRTAHAPSEPSRMRLGVRV